MNVGKILALLATLGTIWGVTEFVSSNAKTRLILWTGLPLIEASLVAFFS
jgi:hypothetical protein